MNSNFIWRLTVTLVFLHCFLVLSFSQIPGSFQTIELNQRNSRIDGYNLYVPDICLDPSEGCPLIVFLQGGLGVGGEVKKIYNWELPKYMKEKMSMTTAVDEFIFNKFIFVMPHIAEGQFYDHDNAGTLRKIIADIASDIPVDMNRTYLTGLSRGGHGTWGLASQIPHEFAAIAPIAGSPDGVKSYQALAKLPIWTSHNTGDQIVSYHGTDQAVSKIEDVTNRPFLRVNSLKEVDVSADYIFISTKSDEHDAWMEVYTDVQFYQWLLRHSK